MASPENPLGLLVLIHAKSPSKRDQLLALNKSFLHFHRAPANKQFTRTIFTPATRPKASLGMVPAGENETLVGLVEVWETAGALAAVTKTADFKRFFGTIAEEGLFDRATDMEVSRWVPSAGFVVRKGEGESPGAGIVMLAKFVVKEEDVDKNREGLVGVLGNFCNWVEQNEPGTLTYTVFASATNPTEVLMFERYRDLPALAAHGRTNEFRTMFKGTGRFIQGKKTVLSEWVERDGSYVTDGQTQQAKL